MSTKDFISDTDAFIKHLKAKPVEDPLFAALAQTWGTQSAGGNPSPSRDKAEDIVHKIKKVLTHQMQDAMETEDASKSAPDQELQTLKALFASVGLSNLLDDLLDSNHAYGHAFHKDCEILWHTFDEQKDSSRLRTDFMWVRAEYIRIKDYLKATRGKHVVITGQPGIGALYRLSSISANDNKGKLGCSSTF